MFTALTLVRNFSTNVCVCWRWDHDVYIDCSRNVQIAHCWKVHALVGFLPVFPSLIPVFSSQL